MSQDAIYRLLLAGCALAVAAALVACTDGDNGSGNGGGSEDSQAPAASPTPLALDDWVEQVCALAVEAADTLDVPGPEDPETLSLQERKQRAADVLTPRARALKETGQDISRLEPPEEAAEFNEVLRITMLDVASIWQDLVTEAEQSESAERLNQANDVFIQGQNEADAAVLAAYDALDDETAAALSEPEDCGVLNEIRS